MDLVNQLTHTKDETLMGELNGQIATVASERAISPTRNSSPVTRSALPTCLSQRGSGMST